MKPNTAYLLTLLSNNDVTFFIPPYQRNYEWKERREKVVEYRRRSKRGIKRKE